MNNVPVQLDAARQAFLEHRFEDVLAFLSDHDATSADGQMMLGMSAMRTCRYDVAERALRQASQAGHAEASVELGNLLRLTGRYEEALRHFDAIEPLVKGTLLLRLERWRGTSEFCAGKANVGLSRLERVYRAHVQAGEMTDAGRVLGGLAVMYANTLAPSRTESLLLSAHAALQSQDRSFPKFQVLHSLLNLRIALGRLDEARDTTRALHAVMPDPPCRRCGALLQASLAMLCQAAGDERGHATHLENVARLATSVPDAGLMTWLHVQYAQRYSLQGEYGRAHLELLAGAEKVHRWNASLLLTRARVQHRRNLYDDAVRDYLEAAQLSAEQRNLVDRARALLYSAQARHEQGRRAEALRFVRDALCGLPHPELALLLQSCLRDVQDVLVSGVRHPDLRMVLRAYPLPHGILGAPDAPAEC